MSAVGLAVGVVALACAAVLAVWLVAALQAAGTPRVLCLMYHRVVPRSAWSALRGTERVFALPEEELAGQLRWLREQGYAFVTAADVAAFARGEAAAPERAVLVTVDDGCESAHAHILPVLRREGGCGILFVTTDPASHIFQLGERRVTDDELRALVAGGMEIGSHAVSHRPLSAMDEAGIRRELAESKQELERVTGRPVRHFAVPANWYDGRVLRIAREVGYESVFCSRPDTVRAGSGAFGIPRLNVEGHLDLAGFARALSPAGIAQRRLVLFLRGLPRRALGPVAWTRLRQGVFRRVRGDWLSPTRMARALAASVGVGLLVALGWLLARG